MPPPPCFLSALCILAYSYFIFKFMNYIKRLIQTKSCRFLFKYSEHTFRGYTLRVYPWSWLIISYCGVPPYCVILKLIPCGLPLLCHIKIYSLWSTLTVPYYNLFCVVYPWLRSNYYMSGYDVKIFEANGEKLILTSYPDIYILLKFAGEKKSIHWRERLG
jgi:hypothetical protein